MAELEHIVKSYNHHIVTLTSVDWEAAIQIKSFHSVALYQNYLMGSILISAILTL